GRNAAGHRTQIDSHRVSYQKPLLSCPLFQPFSPAQAMRVPLSAALISVSQERHCHAQNLVVILQKLVNFALRVKRSVRQHCLP
ncbi:MAG TPA: hypothetical protein VGG59_13545, partial [Acidobacteriaceae bacterium]